MKRYLLIVSIALSATLSAQSFEKQFRAFQKAAQQNYTDFRDEVNQKTGAMSNYLVS